MRALFLAVLLTVGPSEEAPQVRVTQGSARLLDQAQVRTLDRTAPSTSLRGESGWVESGARSSVELHWRGRASVTLTGPAAFGFSARPALELERVQTAEVEVRRGKLALVLADLGSLELESGALSLRALPSGAFELTNRGGSALELRRPGQERVRIASGERVRLRPQEAR